MIVANKQTSNILYKLRRQSPVLVWHNFCEVVNFAYLLVCTKYHHNRTEAVKNIPDIIGKPVF